MRRRLRASSLLTLLLGALPPAGAWVYPEHRDIAVLAVGKLGDGQALEALGEGAELVAPQHLAQPRRDAAEMQKSGIELHRSVEAHAGEVAGDERALAAFFELVAG